MSILITYDNPTKELIQSAVDNSFVIAWLIRGDVKAAVARSFELAAAMNWTKVAHHNHWTGFGTNRVNMYYAKNEAHDVVWVTMLVEMLGQVHDVPPHGFPPLLERETQDKVIVKDLTEAIARKSPCLDRYAQEVVDESLYQPRAFTVYPTMPDNSEPEKE